MRGFLSGDRNFSAVHDQVLEQLSHLRGVRFDHR